MASAQYAVLRSAFPAISAREWLEFTDSDAAVMRESLFLSNPESMLTKLREICGGWAANFADWKEFALVDIKSRRELIVRAAGPGVPGYPKLGGWLADQRARFRTLVEGQWAFVRGREKGIAIESASGAIGEFQTAIAKFSELGQKLMTALARTFLGAALVNRAHQSLPGQIILKDAAEAERQLTLACEALRGESQLWGDMEGSALAWRARAQTLLAEIDPARNEDALRDAKRAVAQLSAAPQSQNIKHDLAVAHLHLARAHFFKAIQLRQRGRPAREDLDQIRQQAARALEVGRENDEDDYVRVNAKWLIEHAEGDV